MMSKITAVARRPSGNTMSIGCTGCPANLALLSIVASWSEPSWLEVPLAPELLLHPLQATQVSLHVGQGLLQISFELVVNRRKCLTPDPVDVGLMGVDLKLDERLVELRSGRGLEILGHGNAVAGGNTSALARGQCHIQLFRQGTDLLAVLGVIGDELLRD